MLQVKNPNAVTNPEENPFEAYGNAATNNRIVGQLLKFSKGDYLAGQDETVIALGTKLVAIMDQLWIGWIKWRDGRPADHVMGLVSDGYIPPKRAELDDNDKATWETADDGQPRDPWQFSNYLVLIEPKEKVLYTFATATKGGLGAIGDLCKVYGKAMRGRPDDYPVIELGVGSYQHPNKTYGRIKYPIFIKTSPPSAFGWAAKAPLLNLLEGGVAAEPESDVIKAEREEGAAKAARRGVKLEETF
jgi:hypothetical protein